MKKAVKIHFNVLVDVVLHPRKYDHVINVPMRFDAAEYLLMHYWNDVNDRTAAAIEKILLHSGKYEKQKINHDYH